MAGKMDDPLVTEGGSPQEILAELKKLANYSMSKEEDYVCTKVLHKLNKHASLPDFLDACNHPSRFGITRMQMERIDKFVKELAQFVW
jgi:hypothetical protein